MSRAPERRFLPLTGSQKKKKHTQQENHHNHRRDQRFTAGPALDYTKSSRFHLWRQQEVMSCYAE